MARFYKSYARTVALSFTVVAALGITSATAALGASYATSSAPQTVSGYGSTARSYGNWKASRISASQVRSQLTTAYYKYTDAHNHTVYVKMDTQVAPGSGSINNATSHDNIVSGSWTAFRSRPSATLWPATQGGTAEVQAVIVTCLDIPARPDVCSSGSKTLSSRV